MSSDKTPYAQCTYTDRITFSDLNTSSAPEL